MAKYLDITGLTYLWGKIKGYAKITTTSGTTKVVIGDNEVVIPSGLSPYTSNPAMNGTASAGSSDLFSRGDHVHPKDTTKADKATTLAGYGITDAKIANGVITLGSQSITPLTSHQDISGKANLASPTFTGTPAAPTASAGTNTTQIATTAFVTTAVANGIAGITGIEYSIVSSLPASGQKGVIYLVANSGSGTNSYDEYIWLTNKFEKIGTTDVDLSGYLQTSDAMDTEDIDDAIDAAS